MSFLPFSILGQQVLRSWLVSRESILSCFPPAGVGLEVQAVGSMLRGSQASGRGLRQELHKHYIMSHLPWPALMETPESKSSPLPVNTPASSTYFHYNPHLTPIFLNDITSPRMIWVFSENSGEHLIWTNVFI